MDKIECKELTTKEIRSRENKKSKKNRGKEKYKVKGTKMYVTFIGTSRPKKREVK